MAAQRLTDAKLRQLKPRDKTYKVADGGGLYLEVVPKGGRYWRYKYRFNGVEKRLALGVYPATSLAQARDAHFDARRQVASGIDPGVHRRLQKNLGRSQAANSFGAIGQEWLAKQSHWSPGHAKRVIAQIEAHAMPWLREVPIVDITAPQLIRVLERIAERGHHESAHRLAYKFSQIFAYALLTGRIAQNPAHGLSKALPAVKKRHHAAITRPDEVGALIRSIDGYRGNRLTELALRLAPLVFVRPGELRQAEWAEVNFSSRQWLIPAHKIKQRRELIVPLSRQAIQILEEANRYSGDGKYVFPSIRSPSRPMSDNTILSALRNLGYSKEQMTGHGFRAMARTLLAEDCGYPSEAIEHQLSHAVPDPNGRAYNRTQFLPLRTEMMQDWADYLDRLRDGGGEVVSGVQQLRPRSKAIKRISDPRTTLKRRSIVDGRKDSSHG